MEDIKKGDMVRSFDFETRDLEGDRACYVEGVVEEVGVEIEGCPRYRIRVARSVFRGEKREGSKEVFPPVNGTPTLFGEVCNGVEKIG